MTRLTLACFLALVASVCAQTPSTPPPDAPLRPVINAEPVQPASARYELAVEWSEKRKDNLAVPLENKGTDVMNVLGVQSSAGIYIVDYPSRVKAGASEPIDIIYEAADNTDSASEYIRVKTDQGIKTIIVSIKREDAFTLDSSELKWAVGGAATAKSFTVNIKKAGLELKKAKCTSGGHKAQVEAINSTTYRVTVTPGSTAKAAQFAVFLEFDKALPGKAAVVYGAIGE